ncbi:uncharacterized protein V6R79_014977 [Siganus canaliculatus]
MIQNKREVREEERDEIPKTDSEEEERCPGAQRRTECDSSLTPIMPQCFLLMRGDPEPTGSKTLHFLLPHCCEVTSVALEHLTDVMRPTTERQGVRHEGRAHHYLRCGVRTPGVMATRVWLLRTPAPLSESGPGTRGQPERTKRCSLLLVFSEQLWDSAEPAWWIWTGTSGPPCWLQNVTPVLLKSFYLQKTLRRRCLHGGSMREGFCGKLLWNMTEEERNMKKPVQFSLTSQRVQILIPAGTGRTVPAQGATL